MGSTIENPQPSVSDIRRVAVEAKPELQEYLNCGAISSTICDGLSEAFNIDCAVVDGYMIDGAAYDEHAYVRIPRGDVDDAISDVIVDGSLKQFCDENVSDGKVWVSVGKRDEIPTVVVINQSDDVYDYYAEHCPF